MKKLINRSTFTSRGVSADKADVYIYALNRKLNAIRKMAYSKIYNYKADRYCEAKVSMAHFIPSEVIEVCDKMLSSKSHQVNRSNWSEIKYVASRYVD